ncbi:hypothetical protein RugamoR64_19220 [Duganella rhizosphaerae]
MEDGIILHMVYAVLAGNYIEAVQWLLFRKLIGAIRGDVSGVGSTKAVRHGE